MTFLIESYKKHTDSNRFGDIYMTKYGTQHTYIYDIGLSWKDYSVMPIIFEEM